MSQCAATADTAQVEGDEKAPAVHKGWGDEGPADKKNVGKYVAVTCASDRIFLKFSELIEFRFKKIRISRHSAA